MERVTPLYEVTRGQDRFTYDDDAHVYTLNGAVLPSNTRILEAGGITSYDDVPQERLEYAKNRGKAVHRAVQLYLEGTLDRSALHPDISPYLMGFERFLELTRFEANIVERPIYSKQWRFATTPDLIGQFPKNPPTNSIVEIKTTAASVNPGRIQTAGQLLATTEYYAPDAKVENTDRYVLELKPLDFKLHGPFLNTQEEIVVFQSCVWISNWKMRYGRQNGGHK